MSTISIKGSCILGAPFWGCRSAVLECGGLTEVVPLVISLSDLKIDEPCFLEVKLKETAFKSKVFKSDVTLDQVFQLCVLSCFGESKLTSSVQRDIHPR